MSAGKDFCDMEPFFAHDYGLFKSGKFPQLHSSYFFPGALTPNNYSLARSQLFPTTLYLGKEKTFLSKPDALRRSGWIGPQNSQNKV